MTATIKLGKDGRLLVPKAVRDRLRRLGEGAVVTLECDETADEQDAPRVEMSADGLPVIVGWKNFDAVKAVKEAREDAENRLLARLGR